MFIQYLRKVCVQVDEENEERYFVMSCQNLQNSESEGIDGLDSPNQNAKRKKFSSASTNTNDLNVISDELENNLNHHVQNSSSQNYKFRTRGFSQNNNTYN